MAVHQVAAYTPGDYESGVHPVRTRTRGVRGADRVPSARSGASPAPEVTSSIMRAVRTRGTRPEERLRGALRALGLRHRTQYVASGIRVDIAFPVERIAVFVDGDFWHGHSWRGRGFVSLEEQFRHWKNGSWWLKKVRTNMARDRRQGRKLRGIGWSIVRIRESDIELDVGRCARRVERAVRG